MAAAVLNELILFIDAILENNKNIHIKPQEQMEDYKKKYEEALERMKSWAKGEHPECFSEAQKAAEFVFPEIKASEDERIRKEIIDYLKGFIPHHDDDLVAKSRVWIAWLEKQGKLTEEYEDKLDRMSCESFDKGYKAALEKQGEPQIRTGIEWVNIIDDACDKRYAEEYAHGEYCHEQSFRWGFQEGVDWLEKKGEQKPEIKYIYPKFRVGDVIEPVKPNGHYAPVRVKYIGEGNYSCESDDCKSFLSFPVCNENEYVLKEQKSAWSEEDESMLQNILECLKNGWSKLPTDILKYESWLESIKERYTWKPSDEQMGALNIAIGEANSVDTAAGDEAAEILTSLYEQLKKLMEE